jgi:hypothetical protein
VFLQACFLKLHHPHRGEEAATLATPTPLPPLAAYAELHNDYHDPGAPAGAEGSAPISASVGVLVKSVNEPLPFAELIGCEFPKYHGFYGPTTSHVFVDPLCHLYAYR